MISYFSHRSIIVKTASLILAGMAIAGLVSRANASVIDLGAAGQFTLLALGGGIDDSGPLGPQANPYSIKGPIGVVTAGQKFQASGSVKSVSATQASAKHSKKKH